MKKKYLKLLNQAKKLYSEEKFPQALEHFKTLLALLLNERQVSTPALNEIKSYIKSIEDPVSFAQENMIEQTRLTVLDLKKNANVFYKKKQFENAVLEYQKLVVILRKLPDTQPDELADAIWNVGTAYESWAVEVKNDPIPYKELLTQAMTAIEEANSLYPATNTYDHTCCENTLKRLNFALNSLVSDISLSLQNEKPSDEHSSSETKSPEKATIASKFCDNRQEKNSTVLSLNLALTLPASEDISSNLIFCTTPGIQTHFRIHLNTKANPRSLKEMAPSELPPKKRKYSSKS